MLATDVVTRNPAIWADIPTTLLRAELTKRQDAVPKPACGSGENRDSYNTSLHVGALILILVLSTAGKCRFLVESCSALTRP